MEEKSWLIFWQGMAMIAVPALAAGGVMWKERQNKKPRRFDPDLDRYERNLKRRMKP